MVVRQLKKLSTAKILTKKVTFEKDEDRKFLYRVNGIASGFKEGMGDYGKWVGLTGTFKATLEDGSIAEAPIAFIPVVQDHLVAALRDPSTGELRTIQFSVDVFAIKSEKSSVGYEFDVLSNQAPSENDPFAALEANLPPLPSKLPQIVADIKKLDQNMKEQRDAETEAKAKRARKETA